MTKVYRPVRDRGVWRAIANPKNPNHSWAMSINQGGLKGLFRWVYREKGYDNPIAAMLYDSTSLWASLAKKESK